MPPDPQPTPPKPPLTENQQKIADLLAEHLQHAGCSPGQALDLADDLTRKGWKPKPPRALPEYALTWLMGARPPWAWLNLNDEQREWFDADLQLFVRDYNQTLITCPDDIIPACWRLHPPLVQLLPTLFWSWHNTHRHPSSGASYAVDWQLRTLPTFQARLSAILGDQAARCRSGEHTPGDDVLTPDTRVDLVDTEASYVDQGPAGEPWRYWYGTSRK